MRLSILDNGSREGLKGVIHGAALCLAVVTAAYNTAAWLHRREPHLAVNSVIYIALVFFEHQQVRHHLASSGGSAAPAALRATAVAGATEDAPVEKKAA